MSGTHKSTRLGDLLVERGTITRYQLIQAIKTQQERRLQEIRTGSRGENKKELGEILIELGFINRSQLDSSLGWQHKLRKTTLVMAFMAPLLTAACGGGAAGSNNATGGNAQTGASSSQPATAPTPGVEVSTSSSASSTPSSQASSSSSVASSLVPSSKSSSSKSSSSAPTAVSSSSVTVSSSSSSPPASSSSSSSQAGVINGPVVIYWSVPTQRENGEDLDITEIGGYELRYKLKSTSKYTQINIDSGFTDTYYFDYLQGEYEFEIATFDDEGLYSDFVKINPT